jgi:molybdate transport repressor ModE-like protein
MTPPKITHPAFKMWLETEDGYVFGPGVYSILRKIQEKGTLKESAGALGMSYRYAWGLIRKAEETLGEPLVSAYKGGSHGGGGAELTETALRFIGDFEKLRATMEALSVDGNVYTATVKSVSEGRGGSVLTLELGSTPRLAPGDRVRVLAG